MTKQQRPEKDVVNQPPHYKGTNGEDLIDMLEAFGMHKCGHKMQALQYIFRAGKKEHDFLDMAESEKQDLLKAIWYLNRRISLIDQEEKQRMAGLRKLMNTPSVFDGEDYPIGKQPNCS